MFSQVSSVWSCREHNLGSLFMVSGYSSVCSSTRHTCFLSCPVAFLLPRELFKCAALKFNFSSVEWRKTLCAQRGKHSSHLRVNVKNEKDKNEQLQLKKMMRQRQHKLNPRKENSSGCGWKSIRGWVTRKIAITCTAEFAWRLGNLKEWARKPSTEIFKTPPALTRHVGLLKHRVALQGPEIRKSFEEARRKGETKQNKAVLVLFRCVQWLCLLELLHDLGLDDIANQSKAFFKKIIYLLIITLDNYIYNTTKKAF